MVWFRWWRFRFHIITWIFFLVGPLNQPHLENMRTSNWIMKPHKSWVKHEKIFELPPPRKNFVVACVFEAGAMSVSRCVCVFFSSSLDFFDQQKTPPPHAPFRGHWDHLMLALMEKGQGSQKNTIWTICYKVWQPAVLNRSTSDLTVIWTHNWTGSQNLSKQTNVNSKTEGMMETCFSQHPCANTPNRCTSTSVSKISIVAQESRR